MKQMELWIPEGKFKGQFRATGVVPKCIEKIRRKWGCCKK